MEIHCAFVVIMAKEGSLIISSTYSAPNADIDETLQE